MADYPSSIKTFTTWSNGDDIDASNQNQPNDEITAIETALLQGFSHNVNAPGFRYDDATSVSIASGVITITTGYLEVDTEGAAAADDLDTITIGVMASGVAIGEGSIIVLQSANASRVVTVKNGTGNITLNHGDCALSATSQRLVLLYSGSAWVEVARSGATYATLNVGALTASGAVTLTGNASDTTTGVIYNGTNGGSIAATNASGALRFYTGGTTLRGTMTSAGVFSWVGDSNFASVQGTNGLFAGAVANSASIIAQSSNGSASTTHYIGNQTINTTSDRRIKTDITPSSMDAEAVLSQLAALVVDHRWNDPTDTAPVNRNSRGTWTGLIAQDVVHVLPYVVNAPRDPETNAVDFDSPERWHMEYEHFTPALILGWARHQARLQDQERRIVELEQIIARLQAQGRP